MPRTEPDQRPSLWRQATASLAPTREQIAARAFERYVSRQGRDGSAVDDWLDAERELRPGPIP
jgi:hypothetical protein